MAQKKSFKTNPAMQFISAAEEEPIAPQQEEQPEGVTSPKGYMLVKEMKTERVQLLIRPTTKAQIKQEAAAKGISLNDLVNQILEEHIERHGDA